MLNKNFYSDIIEFKAGRTIMGRPLYLSHFYFIDGLLIDTGPPNVSSEVFTALKELPIDKVVITHQHEDHTGCCRLLRNNLGLPVYAHPETLKAMSNPPPIKIYRKVMWGSPARSDGFPLNDTITTENHNFWVIPTPGHSKDHVSFFEPLNKWLFSGDLYLGERLTGFMAGENIADHLSSLQRAIELQPKVLFCGLKGRLDNAGERLARKYEYWWELGIKVKDMLESGASRRQILTAVFGGEVMFYYLSQLNWGRRHMLDSIIENIDYFASGTKKESLVDSKRVK